MATLPNISPELIKAYQEEISKSSSASTARRKQISLKKFFNWAEENGKIPENPLAGAPVVTSFTPSRKVSSGTWVAIGGTVALVILVFLFVTKIKLPIPFKINFAQESTIQTVTNPQGTSSPSSIPANGAVIAGWNLYAKLRLTDTSGTPQVGSQSISFKLYNQESGGTALYTSSPQNVTTDSSGSALISLDSVPTNLFFQNNQLYLEPELTSSSASATRIPVSTANTASNLEGYYPANPTTGAGPLTVPIIDQTGSLNLASEAPAIKGTQGNLLVEGQAVTIKSADGSGGNIEINPDANGYAHFLFEGNKGNFLNAQAPNLTSGSLYYGMVPNSATGYYLLKLDSGSPKMTTRYTVDALGNTNQTGSLSTLGTTRLTSGGALTNITGYQETSGNFTISQGAGDYASIVKNNTALSDVLTLTLNENNIAGSRYSTLTLNRYGGDDNSQALLVKNGNAEFDGQIELGNFTANPTAMGTGSVVYNSTDGNIYYWDGSAWIQLATGASSFSGSFGDLLSGTNNAAAMIVGTGASLTYSGSGTINASSLNSLTSSQFLRSDTSTNYTSGTLTTNAGTTLDILGNFQVGGSAGASGQLLTSAGAGSTPTWTDITSHLTQGTDILITGTTNATISDNSTLDSVTGRGNTTSNAITVGNFTANGTASVSGNLTIGNGSAIQPAYGPLTLNYKSGADSYAAGLVIHDVSGNIDLAGGFADNGCTIDNSLGTITCTAGISASSISFTNITGGTNSSAAMIVGTGASLTYSGSGVINASQLESKTWEAPGTIGSITPNTGAFTYATISASLALGNTNASPGPGNLDMTGNLTAGGNADFGGTLTSGTSNGFQVDATGNITNIGGVAHSIANSGGNLTLTSNSGSVAFGTDNDLIPTLGAGNADIGAAGTPWDRIYGTAIYQGAGNNQVCDTSGNCNTLTGYWTQTSGGTTGGVLYPSNTTVDLLVGGTATASAKFAFMNVDSANAAIASISGSTNNPSDALFMDGAGNISTTNRNNLTLGNSSTYDKTGNILLNPNGTGLIGIRTSSPGVGLDINAETRLLGGNQLDFNNPDNSRKAYIINTAGTGNSIFQFYTGAGTTPSEKVRIDQNGNLGINTTSPTALLDVNGNASVSGSLTFHAGTGTIQTTAFSPLVIGGDTTGNITFKPSNGAPLGYVAPAVNNVTDLGTTLLKWANIYGTNIFATAFTQGGNAVCDQSGSGCPATFGINYWQLNSPVVSPSNISYDLAIGGTGTSSAAFQAYGAETPTSGIAKLKSTVTSTGNVLEATASALTSGNIVKLGYGGTTAFSGNGLLIEADTYGGGSFSGNFIRLNNNDVSQFAIDSTGNITMVGSSINASNLSSFTTAPALSLGSTTSLTLGGNSTVYGGTGAGGTLNLVSTNNGTQGNIQFFGTGNTISPGGNLTIAGTTTFNSLTYTWPGSVAAPGRILQVSGSGPYTLDWVDPNAAVASSIYWTQDATLGILYPKNNSVDVLIGSNSTSSAKFAFKNVLTGVPTASISGNIANVATFIDGNGNISTTNGNNLTLGNSSTYPTGTGNILLNPNGTGFVGIGTTAPDQELTVAGNIQLTQGADRSIGVQAVPSGSGSGYALNINGGNSGPVSIGTANGGDVLINGGTGDLTNGDIILANLRGRVGIGTTSPGNLLSLALSNNVLPTTGGSNGINIVNTDTGSTSTDSILFTGIDNTSTLRHSGAITWGKESAWTAAGSVFPAYLAFYTRPSGGGSELERLRITSAGNLLPGADNTENLGASPSSRWKNLFLGPGSLHVQAEVGDAGYGGAIGLDYAYGINNDGSFTTTVNDNPLTTLTLSGNFGIGNSNPTAMLDVGGTASVSGNLTVGNGSSIQPAFGPLTLNYKNGANTYAAGIVIKSPSGDIDFAGGSSTGCTITNGSGDLTCAGTISGGTIVATSIPFSGITSGTNTSATMVVGGTGTHASLDYANDGTINASSLQGATWASPLAIGSGLAAAGTFTTLTGDNLLINQYATISGSLALGSSTASPGPGNLNMSGNLVVGGTTGFGGVTYTWPGSAIAGRVLQVSGVGPYTLDWVDPNAAVASTIFWTQDAVNAVLYPKNKYVDVLIGADSTPSAKFAFMNVSKGTPTASISGTAPVATYLTGNGNLATTNQADLTLGGVDTGSVILDSDGSNALIATGANLTAGGTFTLPNNNILTGIASYVEFNNGIQIDSGVLNTTSLTATLFNTGATTSLGIGGATTTINIGPTGNAATSIVMSGGSGDSGCTLNGDTGNFTCSGNITGGNGSVVGYWQQLTGGTTGGVLFPANNTVDVLFGGSATTSAKFAFTGVDSGTPTASISGATNIATFIDGNGNISTTNRNNLTLGNSAANNYTGNILLNPNGTGNVAVGLTSAAVKLDVGGTVRSFASSIGTMLSNNGTTGVIGTSTNHNLQLYTNNTVKATIDTSGNFGIGTTSPTALLDVNGNASVSGTLAFHTGTGTIQTTNVSDLVLGGNTSGNITLSPSNNAGNVVPGANDAINLGTSSSLQFKAIYGKNIYQNGNLVCDNSGNGCPAGTAQYWQLNSLVLSPVNTTYDLTIGGSATGSAFQAFGAETGTSGVAKLTSKVTNTGSVLEATSSALTSGNIAKVGYGGTGSVTGNAFLAEIDTYGGGTFTGNFIKFNNNTATMFAVDANGLLTLANGETIDNSTNGIVAITSGLTSLSGDLKVTGNDIQDSGGVAALTFDGSQNTTADGNLTIAGTTGLTFSGVGGDITFTLGEKIDNDVNGTIQVTAPTTALSGVLTVDGTSGNAITISNAGIATDIVLQNGETIDNNVDNRINLGLGTNGTLLLTSGTAATIQNSAGNITINSNGGNLVLADTNTLVIGGHATGVAYNVISDAGGSPASGQIASDNDLYVQGAIEGGSIYQGANQVCDTSGNCSGIGNFWQLNGPVVSPSNTSYDVAVGGTGTSSAKFQAFGAETPTSGIAKLKSTVTTTGSVLEATSSALTSGNLIKAGYGGTGTLTSGSNAILAEIDTYGGGSFTGNFLKFNNNGASVFSVDATGAVTMAGTSITASNLATFTTAASLSMGSTTTLTLGGNSTINGGAGSGGTLTLVSTTNGSKGNIQFFDANTFIDSSGNMTLNGDLTVKGNDIFANSVGAAATVFNTNATSLSMGGAATTINLQGAGSATLNIGNSTGSTALNLTSGTGNVAITSTALITLFPTTATRIGAASTYASFAPAGDLTFVNAGGGTTITGANGGAFAINAGTSQALNLTGNAASTISTGTNTLAITSSDYTLDSSGNSSQSGTLTFGGTATIQSTAGRQLTLGGNTTGNIVISALQDVNGGFVAPNVTNVTDLGLSNKLWRNIYGTAIYQGANQVCDTSGNCAGGTDVWNVSNGAYTQKFYNQDVLLGVAAGATATQSAKFAFINIGSGTPTASISGATNIATFIDGNGNISSTNRNNLTLGNSSTNNYTGNILLNPNGVGNVGIGTSTPTYALDVRGSAAADIINSDVGLNLNPVAPPVTSGMTAAAVPGSGLSIGDYWYYVTFYTSLGTTDNGDVSKKITTTAGNQQGSLTNIPTSTDVRVIGRKIYRTPVNSQYSPRLIATIADNSTTSYTDNLPDGSLDPVNYYYITNTTSKYITSLGQRALTVDRNLTTLGYFAGSAVTTGGRNTLIGSSAGTSITTGNDNVIIGQGSGTNLTTASTSVFVGTYSGASTTGASNTFIGDYSGYHNTSGTNNATLGDRIAYGGSNGGYSNNTLLGSQAGYNLGGNGNIFVGYQAGYNETGANKLYIANSNTATPLIYGDFSTSLLTVNGGLRATGNSDTQQLIVKGNATQTSNLAEFQNSGGTPQVSIDNTGNLTTVGNIADNGGSLTTNQTIGNLFNATATTVNIGGGATTTINIGPTGNFGNIVMSGGSGDTGCTLDGTNGNFTCSGNITGGSGSVLGYWQQLTGGITGGVLFPANNTVDVLIGSSATASAKFAFKNVLTGTPTLSFANQASIIQTKANTANALQITDGTTGMIILDSRNTTSGVSGVTLSPSAPTIAGDAGTTFSSTKLAAYSLTDSTTTTVNYIKGQQLYVDTPIINQSGGAVTISKASTVYIAGAPSLGSSVTCTSCFAIDIGTGAIGLGGSAGTSGQVLTTGGANANPTWTDQGALAVKWSSLQNPSTGLSLTMGTNTTTFNWATGTSTNNLFSMTTDASSNGTGYLLNLATGTSSTVKPFHVSSAGTEAIAVDASGNVGVGTTGPSAKLDVQGTATVSGILTVGNGTTDTVRSPYGPLVLQSKTGANSWSNSIVLSDVTGNIAIGDLAGTKTINIGGVTNSGTDTINIATEGTAADVIAIGNNNASTTLALTGGTAWSVGTTGNAIFNNLSSNGNTTLGNGTSDTITFTGRVNSNIIPSANATYDLGSLTGPLKWNNVYAIAFNQNGNTVCDTSGNCSSVGNFWQLNSPVVSPANTSYDVAVGGTGTASAKFQAFGAETATSGVAKLKSTVTTTGNVLEATSSALTSGNLIKVGYGGTGTLTSGSNAILAEVDTYGGGSFAGNFLKFNNNGAAQFTVDSTGNVVTVGNATIEKHAAIGANAQLNNDTLTSGLFTGTFNNVLTIEERLTDLSANNNFGVLNVLDLNPSVDTTNGVYGSLDLVQTNASNSTNYDYLVGTVGDVYHKGSGHITSAQGGDFEVGSDLAGIIDTAIGVGGGASGATNGTGGSFSVNKDAAITAPGQSYGIYSTASNIGVVNSGTDYTYGGRFAVGRTGATGGTINTYGNYISIQADDAGAGTSAAYGLLIDDTSSAADTNYAIYTNGTAPSSFGGNIIPGSTDAIDLGTSSSLEFNNVYAKVLHQGANLVCDTSGNCAAVGNYWRLNGLVLSPVQAAYDLTIGGNATGSAFQVFAATGNVVSAGYVRGGNLVIGGNGGQATCASVSDGLCGMNNLWETTPGTMYLMPGWNGSSSDQSHQLLIGSSNNNGKGFVAIDGQFGGNAAFTVKPAGAGPDVMSASSSAGLNLFVIRNSGNIGIGTILPDKTLEINSATGNNLRLTYNDADGSATNYTDFSLSASGDLTVTPSGGQLYLADTATLNVGGITNAGYNAFANASDTLAAGTNISADNDLFVGGDFGVNGNLYLLGHNIYNTYGGSSVGAITLATDPTALNTPNYLTDGSWFVQNSVNNGLAALMVDQEKGGDIFSASAAGATKFTISNSGQVAIGSAAPTKTLDVTGDIRLTGKLYDTNVTAGINLGDSSNTALVGFGAGSLVGALNELKNSNVEISHNDYADWAINYKAKAEGSNLNVDSTLNGLFFDTFADSTKLDSVNSTSSGAIQVQDPIGANAKPAAPFRVGLTGGQLMDATTKDNDNVAFYLGSNSVNKVFYYDRGRDSIPQVLVELGIDPNWYNGVTLSVATTSAQFSQNSTVPQKNPNLSTSYNGSLIKASGTYASNPKTIYITITTPTTFSWTDLNGNSGTGNITNASQSLGGTGVSITFTNANYNTGDVFRIASWYTEPSSTTRGAKAQFPERSYIVASTVVSSAGGVDIIDADTQKLWMRFTEATSNILFVGTGINSVSMLNGHLTTVTSSAGRALSTIYFDTDNAYTMGTAASGYYNGNISQRNAALGAGQQSATGGFVLAGSSTPNDVSTTVIPNQPTQTVTVSGWGYLAVSGTNETVNLPYKFNDLPRVVITSAGHSGTTAPTDLSKCSNASAKTFVEDTTTNNTFIARISSADATNFQCYTWTATGTVSPKMFIAVGSSAAAATTLLNETDRTAVYSSDTTMTKVALISNVPGTTNNGALYGYKSGTLDVYYGPAGLGATFVANTTYTTSSIPALLPSTTTMNSLTATAGTSTIDETSNTIYLASSVGADVIQEKQSNSNTGDGSIEQGGSIKYYTKDYITEEMIGDIRGMWPLSTGGAISMSDASVKADTLTNTGSTTAITGVRGVGISLNGSSQDLTCTDANCGLTSKLDVAASTPWSYGAWFKTSSSTANPQLIISKKANITSAVPGYTVYVTPTTNTVTCAWGDGANAYYATSSATFVDGNWHQAVCSSSGAGVLALYVDGIQQAAATGPTTTTLDSPSDFFIGRGTAASTFFNGSLDEPFVTATNIPAGEVKNMYQVGYRALQSHSASLGGGGADLNQQFGASGAPTVNTISDARPDYNNQFMYAGTNSAVVGGLSKIQLNSDTLVKFYTSAANTPTGGTLLAANDVISVAVGYNLEAVGSAASGVKSMSPDNNSNNLTGSLFSKTQTLASSTKFAYLWTSFVTDSNDASNGINVYACNSQSTKALCDSNNAWVLGTIVTTDSTQSPPEREYTFSFTSAGTYLTFKFDFARGSTKTNTYIARYGATWASSVGGADIAERYTSNEPAYPGDILVMDTPPVGGDAAVSLARTPYDTKVIGVVTTNPGIVMDNNLVDLNFNASSRNSPDKPAVALAGRIPVNVSTKNGPILVGDGITSSAIPGVGVKSLQAGQIVGKALNTFDCSSDGAVKEDDGTCQGQVMAIVNVTYFEPNLQFADVNGFSITPNISASTESGNITNNLAGLPFKIVRITTDGATEVVDQIGTFASLIAGNIKSGAITTQDFVADNVIAKVIHTNIISPIPGGTDVTVQIGTATESGKFAIQNGQGNEVASIDDLGNATFSGVVRSQNIDAIQALLNQVSTDQSVLLAATSGANLNSTGSAILDQIAVSDLYVTNQAAVNALSVTKSVAIGTDMVFNSENQMVNGNWQMENTLNTLSAPLKIQSLAMAPVEIMNGLVTIDTKGNVQIAGNLNVAGKITTPELDTGILNATGSATLSSVTTPEIVVAAPDATLAAQLVNGVITTNSTVGAATIPAGVSEITIKNPKVTAYTLVYVTPTSTTQNYVLYVKSKQNGQFVVGFDNPLSIDVNFNWWIVQVTQ